jgi:membrane protease YdiL (CAAX protease family)
VSTQGGARLEPTSDDAISPRPLQAARLVRLSIVFYGALFAVAWAWRSGVRDASLWLATPDATTHWLRDAALGAAAAAAVIVLSRVLTERTRIGRALARALGRVIGRLERRHCLVLAAASGIGEEALFRGAIQPELGLLATSAVFALAHLVPRRELIAWTAFSLAAGLLLGALYDATGNLLAPIVAHFGINAVNLERLSREYGEA